MNRNCCATSVPPPGSFKVLAKAVGVWQEHLPAGLSRGLEASDQTMGHLEEEIFQQTRELARAVLAESAQKKGDQVPSVCPVCEGKLSCLTEGHERSYQPRFGVVTIRRLRGWCRKCKGWCFPADHALGLDETGSCAPGVQEMAASAVSKLPVAEASAVMERLTGERIALPERGSDWIPGTRWSTCGQWPTPCLRKTKRRPRPGLNP